MATDEGGSGDGRGEAKKPAVARPSTMDPVIRKKVRTRQPTLIGLAIGDAKDAAPPPSRVPGAPEASATSAREAHTASRTDAKPSPIHDSERAPGEPSSSKARASGGTPRPEAQKIGSAKRPPSAGLAKPPIGAAPRSDPSAIPKAIPKPPSAGRASPLAFATTAPMPATKRVPSAAPVAKPSPAKPAASAPLGPPPERTEPSVEVPLPSARDLGDELPFEATQSAITLPAEDEEDDVFGGSLVGGGFAGPPEELEAESTQVGYEPPVDGEAEADEGDEGDESGDPEEPEDLVASAERRTPVADIAMEPTLPAASMPAKALPLAAATPVATPAAPASAPAATTQPEDEDDAFDVPPHDPAGPSTSGDLVVEPTVVVSGDAVQDRPQTYSFDPQSGHLALEEPAASPTASKASSVLWVALGAATLIGASGLAFLGWVLLRGDADAPTSTIAEPGVPVEEGAGEETAIAPPAPDETAEGAADPAAGDEGADEGDDEGDEDDPEATSEDEGDEVAPAVGRVIPRAELEGFDLDVPRLARRARRMPVPQRRRTNTRLKTQALRAYRAEEFAEAERLYREAMSYNTWDVASVEGLARTTARLERFPEALAWAELAVERNPRSATAYRVLGDVWRQAGHADEAIAAYRRGLARDPSDRWLRQRIRDARAP